MSQLSRIVLTNPADLHLHLREGALLRAVLTGRDAQRYYMNEIMPVLAEHQGINPEFEPLMTIQITEETTPQMIRVAKRDYSVTAGKVYPRWVTTNSQNGVVDYEKLWPVFDAMEKFDMVLCLHGEDPNENVCATEKERTFLGILMPIQRAFPKLRIVLEHITTAVAVNYVLEMSKRTKQLAATITCHHLVRTFNDVYGYGEASGGVLHGYDHCKPVYKRPQDREALIAAAVSGHPAFFYGGDSAPHPRRKKAPEGCCAGTFNAIVALPQLATVFEERLPPDKVQPTLQNFVGGFGRQFYRLRDRLPQKQVVLVREDWPVPPQIDVVGGDLFDAIVPFRAGETLPWKVAA
jgi:dihydroorotase